MKLLSHIFPYPILAYGNESRQHNSFCAMKFLLTEDRCHLLEHKASADFREITIIVLHSFLNSVQKLSMSSWIFDKITTSCLTNNTHRKICNQESSLWVLVVDSFCCNIIVSVRYTKITKVNLSAFAYCLMNISLQS